MPKPKLESVTVEGWVQVTTEGKVFTDCNIMGQELCVEFAKRRSLLTWEAKRNGTVLRPATLTIHPPKRRKRDA